MGKKRAAGETLSPEKLSTMDTKRLLNYKKTLLRCNEEARFDHPWKHELRTDSLAKSDPEWIQAYADVLVELNTREHIEKKDLK